MPAVPTGRYNLCPERKGFGYGVNGAMAQFVRVPARCLHSIPDTLPFDIACLAEPHSVAYQVMCVNSRIAPGDFVVVIGPGPIGLLCTRMAALSGASTLIVAGLTVDRPRLETARRLGATHTVDIQTENLEEIVRDLCPIGADLVCDASGRAPRSRQRCASLGPTARCPRSDGRPDLIPTDVNPLVFRNIRLQGSFSHNYPVWSVSSSSSTAR